VFICVCYILYLFSPQNVKGSERYNDHYETHHNKVFLYFAKVMEEFLYKNHRHFTVSFFFFLLNLNINVIELNWLHFYSSALMQPIQQT